MLCFSSNAALTSSVIPHRPAWMYTDTDTDAIIDNY